MTKLIFGCGYLGRRVAERWLAQRQEVVAVTRSAERAEQLERLGVTAIVADVMNPATLTNLPAAETVLFAVGYDRSSDRTIEEVYAGGVQNVLAALPAKVGRFLYVSTTGVYGQVDGDWVDEASPCQPVRPGGRAALAAEQAIAAHPLGARSVVLRPAGIYGPGRIPRRAELLAGEPVPAPESGLLNLIHVDDLASVVLAAEQAPLPRLYTVSDGNATTRRDYLAEVARQIGAPAPTFVAPAEDSPAAVRAASSKRVSNRRLLEELGVTLQYPTCREGIAAVLAAEEAAGRGESR